MQEIVVLVFLMTVRWTQTPLYAKWIIPELNNSHNQTIYAVQQKENMHVYLSSNNFHCLYYLKLNYVYITCIFKVNEMWLWDMVFNAKIKC